MIFRIIPCLLLHKNLLFKTISFSNPRYIGDPINAVKIFNDKEADELMLIDIDATINHKEPNYQLIEDIVGEAFMPICYGGGVKTVEQMKRLFSLGIEKISICSAAIELPEIISKAAAIFGSQSIVVTIDVKRVGLFKKYTVTSHSGSKISNFDPVNFAVRVEKLGAGEIIINDVDRDGTMIGYDEVLIENVTKNVFVPVVALGGARTLTDMYNIIKNAGASAAAAGSLFVYHGKLKAVLISYPTQLQNWSMDAKY